MAQYKTVKTMGQDVNAPAPETMGDVTSITSLQHRQNIIVNNKVVVIDNYTDWCGPCKACAPRYAVLAKKHGRPGICVLAKENVEDDFGSHPANITGVPCFHFYINGQFRPEMTVVSANIDQVDKTLSEILA